MSNELFQRYRGIKDRDGIVAAAIVETGRIRELSQITGGTAVSRKVRGGSMVLSELLIDGKRARAGDYIVAGHRHFQVFRKHEFEKLYRPAGHLRDNVV